MAERRMFTKHIIDSDSFLDMPASTQMLYFHLCMRADDDGFLSNPKRIMRMIGASEDDLRVLVMKRFIIAFDTGVIVIKHWRMHNYLRNDRYKPTVYQEELSMLHLKDNNAYSLDTTGIPNGYPVDTTGIPEVHQMDTQVSIGKNSIGKNSIGKSKEKSKAFSPFALIEESDLSEPLKAKLKEWITYKTERKEGYKETGLKSLITQVKKKEITYGQSVICDLIDTCMASNWKGIIWNKLDEAPKKPASREAEMERWANL